eukprot:g11209.t1
MAVALQTSQFEAKLQRAMEQVKLILESEKCAQLPSSEHHSYEDKFSLVERATLLTLASQTFMAVHSILRSAGKVEASEGVGRSFAGINPLSCRGAV